MTSQNSVRISIKVTPNSPRNQVQGLVDGTWKIRIAAPPDKGKANKELLEFLAGKLQVSRHNLTLISGAASRKKILGVTGLSQDAVYRLLSSD